MLRAPVDARLDARRDEREIPIVDGAPLRGAPHHLRVVHHASNTARIPVTKMPSNVPATADRGGGAQAPQDASRW